MIHVTPLLHSELHRLLGARTASRSVYERHPRGRYIIELLPSSGGWRITDIFTGEATDGESDVVEIPTRLT